MLIKLFNKQGTEFTVNTKAINYMRVLSKGESDYSGNRTFIQMNNEAIEVLDTLDEVEGLIEAAWEGKMHRKEDWKKS